MNYTKMMFCRHWKAVIKKKYLFTFNNILCLFIFITFTFIHIHITHSQPQIQDNLKNVFSNRWLKECVYETKRTHIAVAKIYTNIKNQYEYVKWQAPDSW